MGLDAQSDYTVPLWWSSWPFVEDEWWVTGWVVFVCQLKLPLYTN